MCDFKVLEVRKTIQGEFKVLKIFKVRCTSRINIISPKTLVICLFAVFWKFNIFSLKHQQMLFIYIEISVKKLLASFKCNWECFKLVKVYVNDRKSVFLSNSRFLFLSMKIECEPWQHGSLNPSPRRYRFAEDEKTRGFLAILSNILRTIRNYKIITNGF